MWAPDILPLSTPDGVWASGVRGGGGFPVSAAQDGVGIAKGGAGRGRTCTPCLEVNPSTGQAWLLSLQLQAAALGLSS